MVGTLETLIFDPQRLLRSAFEKAVSDDFTALRTLIMYEFLSSYILFRISISNLDSEAYKKYSKEVCSPPPGIMYSIHHAIPIPLLRSSRSLQRPIPLIATLISLLYVHVSPPPPSRNPHFQCISTGMVLLQQFQSTI